MEDKNLGTYFAIFGALYFLFTVFIANHGIHFMNSVITIGLLITSVYFYTQNYLKGGKNK